MSDLRLNQWFNLSEKRINLFIFVKPNAKQTAIVAVDSEHLF